MSAHHHDIRTPLPLLVAAGCMIASVVVFTAVSKQTGFGAVRAAPATSEDVLRLRFADEADGGVGVYDPATGEQLFVYAPDRDGFVRTALRAMAFDRRKAGVDAMPPFELGRAASGRLTLSDPSTGQWISLDAFGAGNARSFAALFDAIATE